MLPAAGGSGGPGWVTIRTTGSSSGSPAELRLELEHADVHADLHLILADQPLGDAYDVVQPDVARVAGLEPPHQVLPADAVVTEACGRRCACAGSWTTRRTLGAGDSPTSPHRDDRVRVEGCGFGPVLLPEGTEAAATGFPT